MTCYWIAVAVVYVTKWLACTYS